MIQTSPELVDLVDRTGTVRKQHILRDRARDYPGLFMQVIIAVIFDPQGRVLVHLRPQAKTVNPGDIDFVCGGVMTGETPAQAAGREAYEETGVHPEQLRVIRAGVNSYDRYCYLLTGISTQTPRHYPTADADWVRFIHPDELHRQQQEGTLHFVDEFFTDLAAAMTAISADHR